MIIKNSPNVALYKPKSPSFKGNGASRFFDFMGDQCNVEANGSLTRPMFFLVGFVFMLGGRFVKSRSKDEKREVVTRDLPAVAISAYGAALLNSGMAYMVSKTSGIPVLQFKDSSKSFLKSSFVSQKQLKDWYSGFKNLENPVINFASTMNNHGGDISVAMDKLGLSKQFKNVVGDKKGSEEVLKLLKSAKDSKSAAFKDLENGLKNVKDDNALLKSALKSQSMVKLGGILTSAALLGVFLPWLNIQTTRKKYQQNEAKKA